jgi:CheY-like chemotaxis protein
MSENNLSRILYVEDEEDIRSIAEISLEDIGGFSVKYCASGKEALEVAESFNPDLFLLDVMMPGMDGPTTLVELRKKTRLANVPAIFMTAKIQEHEVAEYKQLKVLAVIAKPFDPMMLPTTIKQAWAKYYEK